jgi:hypothetical protein
VVHNIVEALNVDRDALGNGKDWMTILIHHAILINDFDNFAHDTFLTLYSKVMMHVYFSKTNCVYTSSNSPI